jgi:hypothetical protein
MQLLLPVIRAGAIAGMGGDGSNVPFNELMAELRELAR